MNYFKNWFETDPNIVIDSINIPAQRAGADAQNAATVLSLTKDCARQIDSKGYCYVYYNSEVDELFKKKGYVTEKVDLDEYDQCGPWPITHLHVTPKK